MKTFEQFHLEMKKISENSKFPGKYEFRDAEINIPGKVVKHQKSQLIHEIIETFK